MVHVRSLEKKCLMNKHNTGLDENTPKSRRTCQANTLELLNEFPEDLEISLVTFNSNAVTPSLPNTDASKYH